MEQETLQQDERFGLDSASSAERTHFCPGWLNLRASIPKERLPQSTGVAAKDGTLIHDALETGDISELDMTQADIAEACNKLEYDAMSQWWNALPKKPGGVITHAAMKVPQAIREKRYWIHDEALNPVTSARVDVAYVYHERALLVDFKTGYKPTTPAQRNFQMKVQAVALHRELGVTHVRVAIAQHRFTSLLSQADYDQDGLERAYAEILFDQWRARQPDAARSPGQHCDYCPCKAWCRENASYAGLPLIVATNAMPAIMPKEQMLEAIAQLQPAELVFLWKRASIIEKMLDAVKDRLKALPADDLADLGLKLEQGRRQSEIKDAGALIDYLEFNGLLGEKEVLPLFDMIFGRVEAIAIPRMIEAAEKEGKKLTKKDASKQLRDLCQTKGWIDFEASRTAGSIKEIE